jgi:hypothetical protein
VALIIVSATKSGQKEPWIFTDAADQHGLSVTSVSNPRKSEISFIISLAETMINGEEVSVDLYKFTV